MNARRPHFLVENLVDRNGAANVVREGEAAINPTLAKALPLLVLCACAPMAPQPGPVQPELARLAQPYARELRAAGITRLVTAGSGALVQLDTLAGPVYLRYPQDVPSLAFALDIAPDGLHATSIAFDKARDAPVLDVLLPEAIRSTASNNTLMWIRNNPEH